MEVKGQVRKARLAILALVALLFTALMPMPLVQATEISILNPTEGFVGDTVTVVGVINTLGGAYEIYFDATLVASGNAPSLELDVVDQFEVPAANGSDAGTIHTVRLLDKGDNSIDEADFKVKTKRVMSVDPELVRQGNSTSITIEMTGGIGGIADKDYVFLLNVTDPGGGFHEDTITVSTNATNGTGSASIPFPGGFSPIADTDLIGTYNIVADETAPGDIPGVMSASFSVGLTDKLTYKRFETVSIVSTGWNETALEEIAIWINDTAGQPVTIAPNEYNPFIVDANATGVVEDDTPLLPVDFPIGTYTLTIVNSTDNGTVKVPPDIQDFDVTVSDQIEVGVILAATPYQRTETAEAELNITYPDTSVFNETRLGSVTVSVFNATAKIADISLGAADFNATTGNWTVQWNIAKGEGLGDHNFTVLAGAIADSDGNTGPVADASSGVFEVVAADLAVAITGQWAADTEFNRTATVSMQFQVTYPDDSFFTPADLGSVAVNVSEDGVSYHIANLTLSAGDFDAVTNNWTAQWTIPIDATLTEPGVPQYQLNVSASNVTDQFGNENSAQDQTNKFNVTAVTLIVLSIDTDRSSYEREEQVFIFFQATYLDGSLVTTGSPGINITKADTSVIEVFAAFESSRSRFEAVYFITLLDPIGNWSAELAVDRLVDVAGNTGPNVTRTATFVVTKAVEALQIDMDVGSLHFRGEIAEFYVLTAVDGSLIAVDSISADLYAPDGSKTPLTATSIDLGIYKIVYTRLATAPAGTYTLVVTASVTLGLTEGRGVALKSFLVSETLSGFVVEISGGVATIQTDVGVIKADVATINATVTSIQSGIATIQTDVGAIQVDVAAISASITAISSGVATIQTDVGAIQVDVADINAVVTDIQGDMATVVTDVGTLSGKVTDIQGDVATIDTGVGQIEADISGVSDLSAEVGNILTILYIATALALIAALGAITAVAVIMRRLAR